MVTSRDLGAAPEVPAWLDGLRASLTMSENPPTERDFRLERTSRDEVAATSWLGDHVHLGEDVRVDPTAIVGYAYPGGAGPTRIGDESIIRAGSVIYADVELGHRCHTGHQTIVRERTSVGDDATIGTNAVLDGNLDVGANVSIQTGAYVPPETEIGDRVFLGPCAVLTNDPYPLRRDVGLSGPTLGDDVSIGANATVLPDVTIGEGAFVAACAVVAEDVPPHSLAVGVPACVRPLPDHLDRRNDPT